MARFPITPIYVSRPAVVVDFAVGGERWEVIPGFIKAATTPNFTGVFANPTFIESLYNYGLFFTFGVAAVAYLALSMIGGRAAEPAREPEAT